MFSFKATITGIQNYRHVFCSAGGGLQQTLPLSKPVAMYSISPSSQWLFCWPTGQATDVLESEMSFTNPFIAPLKMAIRIASTTRHMIPMIIMLRERPCALRCFLGDGMVFIRFQTWHFLIYLINFFRKVRYLVVSVKNFRLFFLFYAF